MLSRIIDRILRRMHIAALANPTAEEVKLAELARSPVQNLSREQMRAYAGTLIALLNDGTVIASAPLDFAKPGIPRQKIAQQVAASPYSGQQHQIRQILAASEAA